MDDLGGGPPYGDSPFQPDNPIRNSRLPLLRPLLLILVAVGVGLLGFFLLRSVGGGSDDDPEAADGDSQADERSGSGSVTGPGGSEADPLEEESVAAIEPALQAVAAEHEEPVALWEVAVWPNRVLVTIQVPGEPELLDRYTWQDGELSRPAPVELADGSAEAIPDRLFTVDDVDPELVSAILANAAGQHPDDPDLELVPTSVTIWRTRLLDNQETEIELSVHTSEADPDSDERWILVYDTRGELLRGP